MDYRICSQIKDNASLVNLIDTALHPQPLLSVVSFHQNTALQRRPEKRNSTSLPARVRNIPLLLLVLIAEVSQQKYNNIERLYTLTPLRIQILV